MKNLQALKIPPKKYGRKNRRLRASRRPRQLCGKSDKQIFFWLGYFQEDLKALDYDNLAERLKERIDNLEKDQRFALKYQFVLKTISIM